MFRWGPRQGWREPSGSRSSAGLLRHERVVLGAVSRRLSREPRRLLRRQVRHVNRVLRPRWLPEWSLCHSTGPLFPRRGEFVLGRVRFRYGPSLHRSEILAVDGRVFALVTSPPLAGDPVRRLEILAVDLEADPMEPGAEPTEGEAVAQTRNGCPPKRGSRARGGWVVLSEPLGRGRWRSDGACGTVAMGPGGLMVVGRVDAVGGRYRALAPGGAAAELRSRELDEALREAAALGRS